MARVRAVLRRTQPGPVADNRPRYADLVLDEDTMRVSRGDHNIQLSRPSTSSCGSCWSTGSG